MIYYMAAYMKNAKPVLLLPEAFREKMENRQINQVVLLQAYVSKIKLFEFMCALQDNQFDQQVYDVRLGLTVYLNIKGEQAELDLFKLNSGYLKQLEKLIPKTTLSKNKKNQKAAHIMLEWERELSHLITYPKIIKVEDLGELLITFNYFLVCLHFGTSLLNDLDTFMRLDSKAE